MYIRHLGQYLEQLVIASKESADILNNLSSVFLKAKSHKSASRLSQKEYVQFCCGSLVFKSDIYESLVREPQHASVRESLKDFLVTIQQNSAENHWQEIEFCQPPTDKLLKALCQVYFTDSNVCCLREFFLGLESDNLNFTADGKLDHCVSIGSEPEEARVDGLPLVYVECKNLNWEFTATDLWQPKGQALVYLTALADIVAKKMNGESPTMYILLQSGFHWILLRRKICTVKGMFNGKYLQSATTPEDISTREGFDKVVCWLMICFQQGKHLRDNDFEGIVARKMSSLSLQNDSKRHSAGGQVKGGGVSKVGDNSKKVSGGHVRGGGKSKGKTSTKNAQHHRTFGTNLTNGNGARIYNSFKKSSHNSKTENQFLSLTEENLRGGWRGVVA